MGVVSIIFFGLIAVIISRKIFDKKSGLIINRQGIIDKSSGVSAGLVLWSDIRKIRFERVMDQKFVMVIVNKPQDYLDKVSNRLRRKTMEIDHRRFGSPISISANALK